MRIIIDLLAHPGSVAPAVLELCAALARQADGRCELWVAAPLHDMDALEILRLEPRLAGRVRAFELSSDTRVGALLRRHAIAGLAPAAVLVLEGQPGAAEATPWPALSRDPAGAHAPDALLDALVAAATTARAQPAPMPSGRPKLAYVSPLPPVHSGIADYSAELVPELSAFYDV